MSDSASNQTNIGGNVNGPALPGSFQGPVQTVHVQMPEPPDNVRAQITDIWTTVVSDQLERRDRQKVVDTQLAEISSQVRECNARTFRLEYAFIGLVVAWALISILAILVLR
jgi:hypothetical protein